MYNFKDENYPEWADDNAEWAFDRNTVSQLGQIAKQLKAANYDVESGIDFDKKYSKKELNEMPLEDYQDRIHGLVVIAHSNNELVGCPKKVIIRTNANNDSILVQAGFDGEPPNPQLWNGGLMYDEIFTKDELGKFSTLWDKIYTNLLSNDIVVPIVDNGDYETLVDTALTKFITDGLRDGYVKKIRK